MIRKPLQSDEQYIKVTVRDDQVELEVHGISQWGAITVLSGAIRQLCSLDEDADLSADVELILGDIGRKE